MKRVRLDELTPQQALKITHILCYGGLAAALLSAAVGACLDSVVVMILLGTVGLSCMIAGIILGNLCVRCPKCFGSLTSGGRIPTRLYEYCPHCGKRIS